MGEAGVFPPDARLELIEGELYEMPPIGPAHAGIVKRLNRVFDRQIGDAAIVAVQDPVILDLHSEPQPDLALLRFRDDFYTSAHPHAEDVLLLVEVADTTLRFDRDTKIPLYAATGIPEVWLIDVAGRSLDVFRYPEGGDYKTETRAEDLKVLRVQALPGIAFDLSDVF